MAIGEKLEALITSRKTNVNKVASIINVSPQTIYGIIRRNNTKVDLDVLQAIADELCVTLDYFSDKIPNIENSKENLTHIEKQHIRKYRCLDDNSKNVVDYILDNEYNKTLQQANISTYTPQTIAAHTDSPEYSEADLSDIERAKLAVKHLKSNDLR